MNNCLETKLKGIFDNSDLPVLNELMIHVVYNQSSEDNRRYIKIGAGSAACIVTSDADMYQDNTSIGRSATIAALGNLEFTLKSAATIRLSSKYELRDLSLGGDVYVDKDFNYTGHEWTNQFRAVLFGNGCINYPINELEGFPNKLILSGGTLPLKAAGRIENLAPKVKIDSGASIGVTFQGDVTGDVGDLLDIEGFENAINSLTSDSVDTGKIYGNVEDFENAVNITNFSLNRISLTGSLAIGLGKMTKLASIVAVGHTAAENLTTLFDNLYTNGKVSGSIVCWLINKTITYNGVTEDFVSGSTITFSSQGWTYTKRT